MMQMMMQKNLSSWLRFPTGLRLGALVLACVLGAPAQAQNQAPAPAANAQQPQVIPRPPQINAISYILMDAATGEILVEENADTPLAPASLTKIMTTYVADNEIAAGNISLDDEVFVSVKAWKTEGSKMFIQEGTHVRLEDIMRGIIIQSGNDASIALAEHIAGSEDAFADLMNQHANLLGMNNSHFVNASGLPAADHVASARDLAILARAAITRFPEAYKMNGEREFTYNNIRQSNRNTLLFSDRTVDGMKTGFTDDAKYCLVASAVRDDMRLITVVMGAESPDARAQETQKLLTYGFRFFETHQLFSADQVLETARVWSGAANEVPVGVRESLVRTIQRGQGANLVTELTLDETIKAPLSVGQELGRVKVSLGDQVYYDGPVVALQDVERGGLWKRFMDWLYLFFLSLLS
ncbi:MAG: D-alanyl-D-alanine carboxypeptidase [Pseudomonadales bacterium]|jgi:D-alanyl-D-alanine carboxypeptidase (penicillin-binding protein 5/6)|nr:D-alanyl-D-alanine carboxypeptidase [Pseudomonadales bacterium]